MKLSKGFTLIEMLVVITIIGVLSSIILFSVTQYINKGKDTAIIGNLVILIPAAEVYYDRNTPTNSYQNFCASSTALNSIAAIAAIGSSIIKHCYVEPTYGQAWAACAYLFTGTNKAYCVDSTGVKKEINNSNCTASITACP